MMRRRPDSPKLAHEAQILAKKALSLTYAPDYVDLLRGRGYPVGSEEYRESYRTKVPLKLREPYEFLYSQFTAQLRAGRTWASFGDDAEIGASAAFPPVLPFLSFAPAERVAYTFAWYERAPDPAIPRAHRFMVIPRDGGVHADLSVSRSPRSHNEGFVHLEMGDDPLWYQTIAENVAPPDVWRAACRILVGYHALLGRPLQWRVAVMRNADREVFVHVMHSLGWTYTALGEHSIHVPMWRIQPGPGC